jgi:hypothetical protein
MALGLDSSTRDPPESKGRRRVKLTASLPPVSLLHRKCGNIDISQSYPILLQEYSCTLFTVYSLHIGSRKIRYFNEKYILSLGQVSV